jgi:hypothetical protein
MSVWHVTSNVPLFFLPVIIYRPDYEHIFSIDLWFNRKGKAKINGFHHDLMRTFGETNGVFEFVDTMITKTGFYESKIFFKGHYIDTKTFFPAHWLREEVINKIYQVYEDFIDKGL